MTLIQKVKMYKYLTRRTTVKINWSEMDYFAVQKRYKRNLVLQRNIKVVCHGSGAENPDTWTISVLFITPAMQAGTGFGNQRADFCWNGVAGAQCRSKAHTFIFKQMCKAAGSKYLTISSINALHSKTEAHYLQPVCGSLLLCTHSVSKLEIKECSD